MNKKAELFKAALQEYGVESWFRVEEYQDDFSTTAFIGQFAIAGYTVPAIILLNTTLFSVIRLVVSPSPIAERRQNKVLHHINQLNQDFRFAKYYINEGDNMLYMDVSLPAEDDDFNPVTILRMATDLLQTHLAAQLDNLVDVLGGINTTASEEAAVEELAKSARSRKARSSQPTASEDKPKKATKKRTGPRKALKLDI